MVNWPGVVVLVFVEIICTCESHNCSSGPGGAARLTSLQCVRIVIIIISTPRFLVLTLAFGHTHLFLSRLNEFVTSRE